MLLVSAFQWRRARADSSAVLALRTGNGARGLLDGQARTIALPNSSDVNIEQSFRTTLTHNV